MATKHIIGPGIGFSPGSVKYIITRGLTPATSTVVFSATGTIYRPQRVGTAYRPERVGIAYRPDRTDDTVSERIGGN